MLDDSNWASAPATASSELLQQWQDAAAVNSLTSGRAQVPEAVRLLPLFGCHAGGVAELCEFARLAGSKWVVQQQRVLEWLQHWGELPACCRWYSVLAAAAAAAAGPAT